MTDHPAPVTLQDVITQGEKILAELAALADDIRALRDKAGGL